MWEDEEQKGFELAIDRAEKSVVKAFRANVLNTDMTEWSDHEILAFYNMLDAAYIQGANSGEPDAQA